jgi:bifunctional non-homologous end joining protein LigD
LRLASLRGATPAPMPTTIRPMLATLVDEPFNDPEWIFEVKLDGYRAVGFVGRGRTRLVSRNQNEFTDDFPEIAEGLAAHLKAKEAIVDGEICALDDQGRPSFSLMQQRTGFDPGRLRRNARDQAVPIVYYLFDILYLDGYSLLRLNMEERKELLRQVLKADSRFRYSEHFLEQGVPLYRAAQAQRLEGIIAKRRKGCYLQKRTREWLKVKITQSQECVVGGFTEPRGSREHFGSLVLGLYDDQGRLVPVGQAGTGFNRKVEAEMIARLRKLETPESPFAWKPESHRGIHYVKPKLVAQIKFTEWTHEGKKGGLKMRAPVFLGLRLDKKPKECRFEVAKRSRQEAEKAEHGDAA